MAARAFLKEGSATRVLTNKVGGRGEVRAADRGSAFISSGETGRHSSGADALHWCAAGRAGQGPPLGRLVEVALTGARRARAASQRVRGQVGLQRRWFQPCLSLHKSAPQSLRPFAVAISRLHERSCFFAHLPASFFSCCLGLLDRLFEHQFSELMFDGDCRRKFDCSSEPLNAHWALPWAKTLHASLLHLGSRQMWRPFSKRATLC